MKKLLGILVLGLLLNGNANACDQFVIKLCLRADYFWNMFRKVLCCNVNWVLKTMIKTQDPRLMSPVL